MLLEGYNIIAEVSIGRYTSLFFDWLPPLSAAGLTAVPDHPFVDELTTQIFGSRMLQEPSIWNRDLGRGT
jgi:hypothetical protein